MGGQEFVKMIRPLGAALFLIVAVLVTVICFTAGKDPIPGYMSPHDTEYYVKHTDELAAELETNVFPHLEGIVGFETGEEGLVVVIDEASFAVTRAAILRYFDISLFEFEKAQAERG